MTNNHSVQRQRRITPRWPWLLMGFLLLCGSFSLTAAPVKILLLASQDSPVYHRVIQSISSQLRIEGQTDISYSPEVTNSAVLDQYDLVVTIGTKAAQSTLAQKTRAKILSTFIPKAAFDSLSEGHHPALLDQHLSALYLEQPMERQLQLLKLVAPKANHLGTIVSSRSKQEIPKLELLSDHQGLRVIFDELNNQENPVEVLGPIVANSDAFIAIPDRAVFNRSTAKWILLMTFRQKIPLIAFSKSYVDAGALAAIYSTPETIGKETASIINKWQQSGSQGLSKPAYPEQFELSLNAATAHSLGITPPANELLIERLSKP